MITIDNKKNNLTEQRERMGLNQQNLAAYLGISRSLLALVERGERTLPTQALLKFNELVIAFEASPDTANPIPPEQRLIELRAYWTELDWQYQKKQRNLQQLQQIYRQTHRLIHTLQLLQGEAQGDSVEAIQKRLWIEIQDYEARKRLEKIPLSTLCALEVEIAVMENAMTYLKASIRALEEAG